MVEVPEAILEIIVWLNALYFVVLAYIFSQMIF